MWWNSQNLSTPRRDASGEVWHFRVWHDFVEGKYIQRVFFWNEAKTETGVIELAEPGTLPVSRLKQIVAKLVKNPDYRAQFRRELDFPIERCYGSYSSFA